MAVIAVCGRASGYRSGMIISAARIARLKKAVIHIHRPVFVFSLPLDSIVESSNMNSLAESSSGIDTRDSQFVPGHRCQSVHPTLSTGPAGWRILYEFHNSGTGQPGFY